MRFLKNYSTNFNETYNLLCIYMCNKIRYVKIEIALRMRKNKYFFFFEKEAITFTFPG